MSDLAWRRDKLPLLGLFVLTFLIRIPFSSRLLYDMDSVQFALALNDYDITVHQPHPPGYFLYVMMGRLLHLFIGNANTVFVLMSIVFSGLTVVMVYALGKEVFSTRNGLLASILAVTSPNLWFHGEVALTYACEAFFSSAVAYLCWKIYKGEEKYVWISAVLLGVAGGIRQNTVVFLLPLWLFSVKSVSPRKIVAASGLLAVVCLLWFVPMLWMTGGWKAYSSAFRELWLFNDGHVSVFENGWMSFKIFASALLVFILFSLGRIGVGAAIIAFCLAAYSALKYRKAGWFFQGKALFFSLWLLPSTLFYLLVFIHPHNPGYVLIMLPALFVLTAESVCFLSGRLRRLSRRELAIPIVMVMAAVNIFIFLFSAYPVSYPTLRAHDRDLKLMLQRLGKYDATKTAFFVGPYFFFGYRQIMYYLPAYRVYQVDVRKSPSGETRKTFYGVGGKTFLTDVITLPRRFDTFVMPLISDDREKVTGVKGISIAKIEGTFIYLVSGKVSAVKDIYPELALNLPGPPTFRLAAQDEGGASGAKRMISDAGRKESRRK